MEDERGKIMKEYETKLRVELDNTQPFLVRLDGHKFSTFTKNWKKPYDMRIYIAMHKTTSDLIEKFHATFGYTQSDEITLFFPEKIKKGVSEEELEKKKGTDEYKTLFEPIMFHGRTEKISSLLSGYCSVRFAYHLSQMDYKENEDNIKNLIFDVHFDARTINIPNVDVLVENILWRLEDCERNSKNNLGRQFLSQKEMNNLSANKVSKIIWEKFEERWMDRHPFFKHGCFIKKEQIVKEGTNLKNDTPVLVNRSTISHSSFDLKSFNNEEIGKFLKSKYVNENESFHPLFRPLPTVSNFTKKFLEGNNKIEAVIFDLDGIILDTEPFYYQVNDELLKSYGHKYSHSLQLRILGKPEKVGLQILIDEFNLPVSVEDLAIEHTKRLNQLFPTAKTLPGTFRLIKYLAHHNIKIAVATSSRKQSFELKTKNHSKIFSYFNGNIICGDDPSIQRGKPFPDIYLASAKNLGVDPKNCLVFEDSPAGVEAGKSAGMFVCGIPLPHVYHHQRDHYDKLSDLILNSMSEFLPESFLMNPFAK